MSWHAAHTTHSLLWLHYAASAVRVHEDWLEIAWGFPGDSPEWIRGWGGLEWSPGKGGKRGDALQERTRRSRKVPSLRTLTLTW
jgi:hypothetical protein